MTRAALLLPAATLLLLGACSNLKNFSQPSEPASAGAPVEPGADVVQAPVWRVGSLWQYNDGYGLRVERVDGPVTTFRRTDDPNQWLSRRGFLREDAQSATTIRKLVFEDLRPGAGERLSAVSPLTFRREYTSTGDLKKHVTSWSVEGHERVKVPAGEFDCAVIVMRTRSMVDNWTGYERWWFSPQAQNYVRMEYKYGPISGSRVLASYSLAR